MKIKQDKYRVDRNAALLADIGTNRCGCNMAAVERPGCLPHVETQWHQRSPFAGIGRENYSDGVPGAFRRRPRNDWRCHEV